MLGPVSSQLDIDALMERIRSDLTRRPGGRSDGPPLGPGALYAPGTVLHFGSGGNADPFLVTGWSHPETGFRWTEGNLARMAFTFAPPPGELVLSVAVDPLLAVDIVAQNVSASWDGVPIAEWRIQEAKTYHALILAPAFSSDSPHRLELKLPDAFSPSSKNLGTDPRCLGLAFRELVLRSTQEFGFLTNECP